MGLEILTLAIGAASTVSQVRSQNKQARARKEGAAVATANEKFNNQRERRRIAKEARVRRGRIMASSGASGVMGSSGQAGAMSSIGSSAGSSISGQRTNILAAQGVNNAQLREASARASGKRAGAIGSMFQEAIGVFEEFKEYDKYN